MPFVAPVQASAILTVSGTGTENDTFTIGSRVYTLVAEPANPDEVDIGANLAGTITNIIAAINTGAGGSDPNEDVVASAIDDEDDDKILVTAIALGSVGNGIELAENSTALAWSAVETSGGIDGYSYATFSSVGRYVPDSEPSVVLRSLTETPEDGSASENAIPLDTLDTAFWHNKEVPNQRLSVVVRFTELDFSENAEYEFQVQVDTDQPFAGANFAVVAKLPINDVGTYVLTLDGPTIKKVLSDSAYIRSAVTAVGNSIGFNYEAWLLPTAA